MKIFWLMSSFSIADSHSSCSIHSTEKDCDGIWTNDRRRRSVKEWATDEAYLRKVQSHQITLHAWRKFDEDHERCLRVSKKMTSRNVRSSLSTSMHDRNASSHIDLANLMCVRCIKRLTNNLRHICVFRLNRRKCQYYHDQRHKCLSVDVRLRWSDDSLLTTLDASLFLKYDSDVEKRRHTSDCRGFCQSTRNSRVAVSRQILYETNWDRRASASRVWSYSR